MKEFHVDKKAKEKFDLPYPQCMPDIDNVKKAYPKVGAAEHVKLTAVYECFCRNDNQICILPDDDQEKCLKTFQWDASINDIKIDKWEDLEAITPECSRSTRNSWWDWASKWNHKYALCLGCYDNNVCYRTAE